MSAASEAGVLCWQALYLVSSSINARQRSVFLLALRTTQGQSNFVADRVINCHPAAHRSNKSA